MKSSENKYYSQIFSYSGLNIPAQANYAYLSKNQSSNKIFSPHVHPDTEIWYCYSGKAEITVCDAKYVLNTGDIIVANSNELHIGKKLSQTLEYICIQFSPHFFAPASFKTSVVHFKNFIASDLNLTNIFSRLKKECTDEDEYSSTAKTGILYELTAYLMRNFQTEQHIPTNYINSKALTKINDALDYINKNINKNIKIDDIAAAVNISSSRLSHIFQENMGQSIWQIINETRLYNALLLLETTKYSVSQIAYMLGFNNPNYFAKVFKKHYKISPNDVRTNF